MGGKSIYMYMVYTVCACSEQNACICSILKLGECIEIGLYYILVHSSQYVGINV